MSHQPKRVPRRQIKHTYCKNTILPHPYTCRGARKGGEGGWDLCEVAVLVSLEASLCEDSVVVAPGGVRHVDVYTGVVLREELGGNAESASAGERLADSNLLVLDDGRILAQDHLPSCPQFSLPPSPQLHSLSFFLNARFVSESKKRPLHDYRFFK
jgi:hypothetical protein